MVSRNEDKFVFQVNNYINQNQLNELNDSNQIKNAIKYTDIIAYKLRPVLIRVINHKLEFIKEMRYTSNKMMERWKSKVMTAKYQKARGEISLFSEKEEDQKSNIRDETNLD